MLLPYTQDRETGPFFEAAAEEKLVYLKCSACAHALHPPTRHCPACGSWDTAWSEAKGTGRVHSWTVVRHQVHPDFPAPYTLAVVELDDAPEVRLMTRLDGAQPLAPGLRMQVWFEPLADGVVLPQWRPVKEG
jgi:uncharacterized protein